MTVTGMGDDGKEYTIHGYKKLEYRNGHWVEEALISHTETSDGEQVHCESELPLVSWNPKTMLRIRCTNLS